MYHEFNDDLRGKIESLSEKDKKIFEALLAARRSMSTQMQFHTSEALDSDASEETKGISTHMADFGSDKFLHDMQLGMITNESRNLEDIDEAIERLLAGEYGTCQDCSAKIGDERLAAKPYARFCVKCKTIREKNGGLRPDYK